jgi:hypothetical protein
MNGSGTSKSTFAAVCALCALSLRSTIAQADVVLSTIPQPGVVLHDADNWLFYTTGLVAAHYQLIQGDGDPISPHIIVGGQIDNTETQDQNNKLVDSRIRSGFVGTQIGFGIVNKINEDYQAKGFLAVSLNGIDSDKGTPPASKDVDFREAWAALSGPFGTFTFGREFSIFGSASGAVVNYAFAYAVGHPCLADTSTISCGSVGAGPLYAGYNADFRYATPRLGGFQLLASMEDPSSLPEAHITRLPRFEGEANYLLNFGADGKLVIQAQGVTQQVGSLNDTKTGTTTETAWGAMGAGRLEMGGLKLGGGLWTGVGMGTDTVLQQDDQANPLAQDSAGVLRRFLGYFGNAQYDYHGTALTVGAGATFVQETSADAAPMSNISLVKQNVEYHAVLTQRFHSLIFDAEYMHWKSDWYLGESQTLNFLSAGANFIW